MILDEFVERVELDDPKEELTLSITQHLEVLDTIGTPAANVSYKKRSDLTRKLNFSHFDSIFGLYMYVMELKMKNKTVKEMVKKTKKELFSNIFFIIFFITNI